MAAFSAPDSPAGYRWDPVPHGVQYDVTQDLAVRAVFHEAGVPNAIAAQVDRMWNQAVLSPPTPGQIEQTYQATHQQLHRTFGAEADNVVKVANREFQAIVAKEPKLLEMAQASGLANSYYVIVSLWNIARARNRAG